MIYLVDDCPHRECMHTWNPMDDPAEHSYGWMEGFYMARDRDDEPTQRECGVWVVDSAGNEKCFPGADHFCQADGGLEVRKRCAVVGVYAPGEWKSADLVGVEEESE